LHQPVAVDLRFLLAILKINNDLERAGDHCVNIAQSAITCGVGPDGLPNLALPQMITLANSMFRDACHSFFTKDLQIARTVLESDDSLDEFNRTNMREAIGMVKSGELPLESALELLRISRNLERIGDLSTNIAEEVIFHVKAKVVKHHHDDSELKSIPEKPKTT
jgi:phosphate transport system protein